MAQVNQPSSGLRNGDALMQNKTLHVRMIRAWVTREQRLFGKGFGYLEAFSVVPSFYMS